MQAGSWLQGCTEHTAAHVMKTDLNGPHQCRLAPAGLVLCPGNTLPLRLTFRGDRALVQQALEAPPPLTRLIAVVCCQRSYFTPQLMLQRVGCIAELRKMGGGGINLLAKGPLCCAACC